MTNPFNPDTHALLIELGYEYRRVEAYYFDHTDGDAENGPTAPEFVPACDEYVDEADAECIVIDESGTIVFYCRDGDESMYGDEDLDEDLPPDEFTGFNMYLFPTKH